MRVIGNILWFVLGGLLLGLLWCLLGVLLCITIIGIPFGLQCFKMAKLIMMPFGKKVVTCFSKHPVANVLWAIFFGWEMALGYLLYGCLCCITIVGIPAGLQLFKLTKLAFFPFGAKIGKGKK